ncbi:MAG TPA: molecular chaperone DnaK, partial [Balneola sp.]|nr:molecular chaperone DnaK [Balneola sp.]
MNFKKITYSLLSLVLIGSIIVFAADHIDAPAVSGTDADITDYYAFEGASSSNLVFVANVQGLLSPSATADADFNENTMIQFNIDNTGDN